MTTPAQAVVPRAADKGAVALARLEAWLEGWRSPDGYGGPVVHWWRHALRFTGVGCDWRYEGIIHGYLALHVRSGHPAWLRRARRAADEVVAAQRPGGAFRNSCFELNPGTEGTPHEPAVAGALLRLAAVLRAQDDAGWQTYRDCAVRYLREVALARLWWEEARRFRDGVGQPNFVPNKAATLVEALLAWDDLEPGAVDLERYAAPTLDAIVELQVRGRTRLDGGIAQIAEGRAVVRKYLPLYAARCVPALLAGARRFADGRYREAAAAVAGFLERWTRDDGSLPLAVYPGERVNAEPRWQAALGDVLRAGMLLRDEGIACDLRAVASWFFAGQQANGSFATARGFAAAAGGPTPGVPDLLDVLPVAGWNDKAFRYLAVSAPVPDSPASPPEPWETPCTHQGRALVLHEDAAALWATAGGETVYRWDKGRPWATVCAPWLWQR